MSHAAQAARESPGTQRGQPDDAGLIAESCRVPERFGAVFDRHAPAIHDYIARRLGRDAADDLVAETFLAAFRQRASYDPAQPSARPWLYGIATRLVSRRRRDEVRGPAPVREFEVIKDLLITYVLPPARTAELYRALGNIPGVTVDRHAVDVAGRTGFGFQITLPRAMGGEIDQLVLDPKNYDVMSQQLVLAPSAGAAAGRVLSGTAILKSALVSGPGITP